ncbi:hypothetical protein M0657_006654 [Pyricularia oryzae]|nr:hypothetical protein M9X92_007039 [Pyricularia oryzae]KAI7920305.1 hypothetical protein M0657_006654 [Pyricularia oryzae]
MFRSSFISGSLLLLSLLGNVQAGVVQPPAVKSAIIPIELDLDPQLIIKAGGLTPKLAKTVTNQQIVTAALDTDIIQEIKKKHPRKPTYVYTLTIDDDKIIKAWKRHNGLGRDLMGIGQSRAIKRVGLETWILFSWKETPSSRGEWRSG